MFAEIETQIEQLEQQKRYTEAVFLLEEALEKYPAQAYPITEKLGVLYTQTQQYQKALDIWAFGIERGFFYGHNPAWPIYEPYAKFEQFETLLEKDRQLREVALKTSQTNFEVVVPTGYATDQQYPLLLVFHGGNSRIDLAKPHWVSEQLSSGFLVAFIQSYLHYGMDRFGWKRGDQRAWDDIKACVTQIMEQYRVDASRVFSAGISAGGMVAIEVALAGVLEVSGFIGVCPVIPGEDVFNSKNIAAAKACNQRAVIISGEQDTYTGPQAQKIADIFDETAFPYQLVTVQDMGHEYPPDFSPRLDAALTYLQD